MRAGGHERIPTVADAVRWAAVIVDPNGVETAVTALLEGFEDDDRPATVPEHLAGELLQTVRAIDPEDDDPAAFVAAAAAVWLARHPSQAEQGERAIREGVRLVFDGRPPRPIDDWLVGRGIEI